MSKLTLPLQDGKFYVCRDGEVRQAYAAPGLSGGVIDLGGELVYAISGSVWRHPTNEQVKSPRDAVADHVEPAKGHPHAALMALYAQDAAETAEPWTRWECLPVGFHGDADWRGVLESPAWDPRFKYRRKPKTIRIGEYDVPEPLRVAPSETFWVVSTTSDDLCFLMRWSGSAQNFYLLSRGLCHATREAALEHACALIYFTKS